MAATYCADETGTETSQAGPERRTNGGTTPNNAGQARAKRHARAKLPGPAKAHNATMPQGAWRELATTTEPAPTPSARGATAENARPQRHNDEPATWPQGQWNDDDIEHPNAIKPQLNTRIILRKAN